MVTGGTLFEELGLYYVGPIDGHRIEHLVPVFRLFCRAYPALAHVTISRESAITAFAELGIVMLLFSIGLELSFHDAPAPRRGSSYDADEQHKQG